MPYKSNAQRKFFHTDTAKKEGIKPSVVNEFDKMSKGMELPQKKDRHQSMNPTGHGFAGKMSLSPL